METNQDVINGIIVVSDFLSSLLTVKGLLVFIIIFFAVTTVLFFFQSFYRMRLLVSASSTVKKKSAGAVFSALFESFGKLAQNFMVLAPILAGIILILVLAGGVLKMTAAVNAFVEREKHIRELSIAVKYLDQSEKAIAVRVDSVSNGITTLRLSYSARSPEDASIPIVDWRKEITIQGVDIYFDCLVLNFTYSQIMSGRQKNIAIPYRIFSNVVPAEEGVSLLDNMMDAAEEDGFGFIPPVYGERLKQLLSDEQFAKDMGVRSVNGSAPHRIVNVGDRFSVRIEQSGGVAIYE
ncbi:MAG: hypothetical protein LBH75_04225 [Treponema sp.]|jgi:hypothetical protein|nr:hypothetical protein [Treponema sp.]